MHKFSLKQFIYNNKCLVILLCLLTFLVIEPFHDYDSWYYRYLVMTYYLFMIISPYILTAKRKILLICAVVGTLGVLGKLMLNSSSKTSMGLYLGLLLIFFDVFLTMSVVLYSCSQKASNREPVMGSILAYMLIGISFGDIYSILNSLSSSAFAGPMDNIRMRDFLYFSYTTLTTLGPGDIVAASALARRIVSLEAIAGVLYVAVFIGRIIALFSTKPQEVNAPKKNGQKKIRQIR